MVITSQTHTDRHELQLQGRLDANWADHLSKAIETAIRGGHHQLHLDFGQVTYISSAGIRVLLKYYRQLVAASGGLRVVRPTEAVLAVIRLSGLAPILLLPTASAPEPAPETASTPNDGNGPTRSWQIKGVDFESHELGACVPLHGELLGRPDALAAGELTLSDIQRLRCSSDVVAVCMGAFGSPGEEIENRFGEALAVGGVAITLPTDGSSVPDYQAAEGDLVPELQLLYGLAARGSFSRLLRFEAGRAQRSVVGLADLIDAVLQDLSAEAVAFAIMGESASVVGATIKRSPVLAAGQPLLSFPAVRDWLSFTTERTDEKNLVLIAGFATRACGPRTAKWMRSMGPGATMQGHCHGAVFPYRPLARGKLRLPEAVASVIATESAQTVMHLMFDGREFEGVGQTDLMRGACWCAPVTFVEMTDSGL